MNSTITTQKKTVKSPWLPIDFIRPAPDHLTGRHEQFIWKRWGIDINDQAERRFLAKASYEAFCQIYFPHYFYLKPAHFHRRLVDILENAYYEMVAIIGFRGSAKSTHASMAYPIWEAVRGNDHFIILINDTGTQRDINIKNIKIEFETNALLRTDFPLVKPSKKKWTDGELELVNDVFILGRSRGQKVRGLRYRQWRPSLIVGDDLEDLEWVRKKENRNKTERWLVSEVIPAQEETKAKLIIIGNLLHTDALMSRLKKRKLMKVLEFPLINRRTGGCTWPAKYPTQEAIDKQKDKVGSSSVWLREYLLKIVAEDDQLIGDDDIHYYDNEILDKVDDMGRAIVKILDAGVGIDLAISLKDSADFTTMVGGYKVEVDTKGQIFIKPHPVNKHIDFSDTQKEALFFKKSMPDGTKFYVEDVGYQKAALQTMEASGIPIYPMRPVTDKRARLEAVAPYIKSGYVKFPRTGCEALIMQVVGFGVEEHDDLVDALVYVIMGIINKRVSRAVENPLKL